MSAQTVARAYSYVRFSTPEQSKGDSLRRQTAMAADYCVRHGLTLDTELNMHDLGVSAYRGKNLHTSAKLGAFLQAVKAGDVPQGSVLLIEHLDRLSREEEQLNALNAMHAILVLGVDIVTLKDGKRYTAAGFKGMELMYALMLFIQSSDESKKKGERVAAAWATGVDEARTHGTLRTHIVPGWIDVGPDGARLLNPERSAVVRRVFDMYLSGTGCAGIAKALNEDKVPTFGRATRQGRVKAASRWHKSYIQKLLRNVAVTGTHEPHLDGETRSALPVIEGYYPAAIERETFERVQALIETSHKARPGKTSLTVRNILAGLAKCPRCGGAMTGVYKSSGGRMRGARLVCAAAKVGAGFCVYRSVDQKTIEAALIRTARDPLPQRDATVREALENAEGELVALDGIIEDLVAAVEKTASKALLAKLAEREAQRDQVAVQIAELEKRAAESDTRVLKRRRERYRAAMTAKPFDVAAANVALREMVSKVVVDYDRNELVMHWRHDGETAVLLDPAAELIRKDNGAV